MTFPSPNGGARGSRVPVLGLLAVLALTPATRSHAAQPSPDSSAPKPTAAPAAKPAKAPFPAPSARRIAEIASWLDEQPATFGHTADDRAAWDPLRTRGSLKSIVNAAAKLVDAEPPPLSEENFLLASRTGVRTLNDSESGRRAGFLETLVVAEAVENNGRFLPAIERGIDAILGERTWVMAAHDLSLANFNGKVFEVDLASSARAGLLALTDQWLGDRLRPETRKRIREEVRRRVLDPYLAFAAGDRVAEKGWWWLQGTNNWNAVCNNGVVTAGLILLESREERARLLAIAESSIPRYFDGYENDGYCTEGLGYWNYGFGNFALLTEAARLATRGRMDFYQLPKARAAALYPGALEMAPGLYPTYADGNPNARPVGWLLDLMERRLDLGRPDWRKGGAGYIGGGPGSLWLTAFLPEEKPAPPRALPASDAFPDSGMFVFRPGRPTEIPFTVALKGGHNDEHHNHNDLGSYVVGVGNATPLLDPGAEIYTTKTFSPQRYESEILSSYGHAVPVVAGKLQSPGRAFAAKVVVREDNGADTRLSLDLKAGYKVAGLLSLRRDFTYERAGDGRLIVRDSVSFDSPQSFGTALVTTGAWRLAAPDRLRVTDANQGVEVVIASDGAGFTVSGVALKGTLSSKRTATRIGVDLVAPVKTGSITVSIRPLSPAELTEEKDRR